MEEGRIVTLIGAKYAKVGEEFFFLGLSERCELCKLKHSCMTLAIGRKYRIEKVRDELKHDCYIHEDGVCVVEVIEPPVTVAIERHEQRVNQNKLSKILKSFLHHQIAKKPIASFMTLASPWV